MVALMRRSAREVELTRLFTVWAVQRYVGVTANVVDALVTAQQRGLLRRDFDPDTVAATLLAMDGLLLRHLLTPHDFRVAEAFAALAGQVLEDLAADSRQAKATVQAWRAKHDPGQRC
jgi:hypothetical protein